MSEGQRNTLYFEWIAGFVVITGGIIGLIVYKAMPAKTTATMSLEQASDAYDGPKKETQSQTTTPATTESAPSESAEKTAMAETTAENPPEVAASVTTEPAASVITEPAASDPAESETEVKNTPTAG